MKNFKKAFTSMKLLSLVVFLGCYVLISTGTAVAKDDFGALAPKSLTVEKSKSAPAESAKFRAWFDISNPHVAIGALDQRGLRDKKWRLFPWPLALEACIR